MKNVVVLGTGCPKCTKLYEAAKQAVVQSGAAAEVRKVEDLNEILKHGVMMTPALVVDGTVVSSGRVLSVDEITRALA